MVIPEQIFKAYDIRGLAGSELNSELAYKIGRGFGRLLKKRGVSAGAKVVVGRDMRETSPDYQNQAMRGLFQEDFTPVDIGLVSTPLFNFACAHFTEHAGGIMVTASHNPAEYNGFKLTYGDGLPVGKQSGMDELRDIVARGDFAENKLPAVIEKKDVFEDYKNHIFNLVDTRKIKPLKIIIDAGNGMAQATTPRILQDLPVQVEYMYLEPDGTFPNHEANPLKVETLADLQRRVIETKADFGFALDGDADRIGLVDEKGQVVPASFVGGLLGSEVLKNHNNKGHMLYDLRSSRIVPELWEKQGATTEICMVGHANIKKMMKETGAIFASELSLHLYYHDMYDLESSDLSLLYVLRLLTEKQTALSDLLLPFDKYAHSGEINFKVKDVNEVLNRLQKKYQDAQINKQDGLLFTYPDFWFNVRASNTEPVLRLNLEANTKDVMKNKIEEVSGVIIEN